MMKSLHLTILAAALLCSLTCGCDAFRSLAGRPTSKQILAKAEYLRAEEEAHRARIDSLKRVEKQLTDSLAILDSLSQIQGTILNPAKMGGLFTTKLNSRYHIIVGAFHERRNAEKLFRKVEAGGFAPTLISFRNGYNVVGIYPSNTLADAYQNLLKAKAEPFCPSDAWILVNE